MVAETKPQDALSQTVREQLEKLALALQSGEVEPLRQYLEVMGKFHTYSLHNQFLILAQMPSATKVAGIKRWNELGRRVRKGAKAIRILAPVLKRSLETDMAGSSEETQTLAGFKTAYVFDLSQTEGEPLPPPPHRHSVEGHLEPQAFQGYLQSCPYAVGFTDGRAIVINARHAPTDQLCTLFHEWMHAAYHFGPQRPQLEAVRELEAEATAFVLCRRIGLEARLASAEYLSQHWITPELLIGALQQVTTAVREIGRAVGLE